MRAQEPNPFGPESLAAEHRAIDGNPVCGERVIPGVGQVRAVQRQLPADVRARESDLPFGPESFSAEHDVDEWLAADSPGNRSQAGHFIRWAAAQRVNPALHVAAVRWTGPAGPFDQEQR
jgi:hypothetical protein